MNLLSHDEGGVSLIPMDRRAELGLLVLLVLVALGVRLYHIQDPPVEFHPTRQYRSAIIARGLYYQTRPDLPDWQREVAAINLRAEGFLEPPIMEYLALISYRLIGQEILWIPRLLSALFWLSAGIFLYLIGKTLFSVDGAFFAAAFFYLLPFTVPASRSFQPESLLVALLLGSLYMLIKDDEKNTNLHLVAGALMSGAAIFVKPTAVFMIMTSYLAITLNRTGFKGLISRRSIGFAVISLVPALIYYGLMSPQTLQGQVGLQFQADLLLSTRFWASWLSIILRVFSSTILVLALFGLILVRRRTTRAFLVGLWSGYTILGLTFSSKRQV